MYRQINKCRICGNESFVSIVNLGKLSLTGVFPKKDRENVGSGPLHLVKCDDFRNKDNCGLVQLKHNYELDKLYGDNYGYRSGLNSSMIDHLQYLARKIDNMVKLSDGDIIIDIGSNDGTLLNFFSKKMTLIGIDPSGKKFKELYRKHVILIPEFFSSKQLNKIIGNKKAKVITSIAMFYDLEHPISFAEDISKTLDDDGIWISEQSYLPSMLQVNAYDTICHEHLEYYSIKQIEFIMEKAELKLIDVELNKVNGGSFCIIAAKKNSTYKENKNAIRKLLALEVKIGLNTPEPYRIFKEKIINNRYNLIKFIRNIKRQNKKILGYGASTKGNVILQYCGITKKDIPYIAEVNEEKFGRYTPGTYIPIISEKEARKMHPDYFMVLPWHFEDNIIEREKKYLEKGGHLFFPLPNQKII